MSTTFTRQDISVGTTPVDVAIDDINGDGNLDLVVTNLGTTAKLLVMLGNGAGSFSTSVNLDVTSGDPSMGFAKVADMDNDGDLDIVFDSYYNYTVRVLLNDGAGEYHEGTPVSFGARPMSIAIGDVNGDGRTDTIATSQNGVITVLLGDGQGGFQTPISNSSISSRFPGSITLADMNRDGRLDIVASGNSPFGSVSVMLGDGAGGFSPVTYYNLGSRLPGFVTTADVNGDGKLDVLTANIGTPGTVSVLLGNGNGGFSSAMEVSVGANPSSLALADLNGDGKLDLVTANANANSVSIRWGDGTGNFSGSTDIAVSGMPKTIKVADVNKDGKMDIVVTGVMGGAVTVLYGGEKADVNEITASGSGTLKTGDTITFTLTTDHPVSVTGTPELVLSNGARAVYAGLDSSGRPTFTYTVTEGDTATSNLSITGIDSTDGSIDGPAKLSFATPIGVVSGYGNHFDVTTVDVNSDGKLDLVMADGYMSSLTVQLGDGTCTFSNATRLPVGFLASAIATGDINGDGKLDVLTTNTGDSTVSVRLGDGAGNFSGPADVSVENSVVTIALGDVNGDGKLDMLTGGAGVLTGGGGVAVRLGDGAGGFSSPTSVLSSGSDAVFADVNRDGKLDIVASTGTAVAIMLGDGAGNFSSPGFVNVSSPLLHVTVMDLNGDGKVDLLSYGNSNKVSVRLGNGAGGFSGSTQLVFGDTVFDIALGDVNGDGKIDVVAANDGNVSVRLGDGAGKFSSSTDISVDDSVQVVNLADVNDDGKLDILASYNGTTWVLLNTSHGSSSFDGATITTADGVHTGRGVDASRPDAPDLALTNDTGRSATDRITSDGALTIGKETGATLSYVVDGGQPIADYDPAALAEGQHTIEVTQTDLAGNVSLASSITFTIDRTAPDEAVLALATDSGRRTTDAITNDGAVTINGVEDGTTLTLLVDGVATSNYDAETLADGEHTLEAIVTDTAGNVSSTASLTFTLDRSALAPVLALASDTGRSSTDNVTKGDGALTITGVEDDAILSYVVDGGAVSTHYRPEDLADGEHTIEVFQTDLAGNVSLSRSITFTLDRNAPDALVLALASDSGTYSTDRLTNDGSLTISGQETGTTLSYSIDGGTVSATYDPSALEDGEHTIEVFQTDLAGNVSLAGSVTFTLDTTIATPTLALTHDSGTSSTDGLTNDGSLSITGVESGATLSYIVNDGEASATYDPSTFDDGDYTVKVIQTDAAGNVSDIGIISFTYDLTIGPPEPYLANDTGTASNDFVTNDGSLSIAGVEDGATLSYVIDGEHASATYDPTALSDGQHTIRIKQTDAAGNTSYFYGDITFTLDRSRPAAPTLALTTDTGKSATDKITSNGALTISGKESGATLSYIVDGGAASSTYNPSALANGNHTVKVLQTDIAGNVSLAGSLTFTLDRAKPATPTLALTADTGKSATDKLTSNGAITITGKETGATLSYVVDGGTASSNYNPNALTNGTHTVQVLQTDLAGNISSAGRLTFTLDKAAPNVSGVVASGPDISGGSGTLTTGETARFSIALSEAVTITDASKLVLNLGNGEKAVYDATASTATKLVFTYTVGLEETSSNLSVAKFSLNGATIKDAAGNNANLAGAVVNPAGTLVIDGYTGTSGADAYKGTAGANTFRGLGGNDSYVVNHSGDKVIEAANQGTDTVLASISHTLTSNVENLTLTGSREIQGTGNSLANMLTGNGAANILKGADGNDTLKGAAGNDKLYGGLGKDLLIGGSGKDIFVFYTKLRSANIDRIDDFSVTDDTIFLDNDIFAQAVKIGDLAKSAFHIGTSAHAESDRIIYDSKTGKLWYDVDGSGKAAAIQFATLDAGLKITATDFDIIG